MSKITIVVEVDDETNPTRVDPHEIAAALMYWYDEAFMVGNETVELGFVSAEWGSKT